MRFIILFFIFFGIRFGYAQKKSYQSAPANLLENVFIDANSAKGAIDLKSYLPNGYVENGSVDYTIYLQRGINENQNVLMPNFPVMINDSGLSLKSNMTMVFQPKSQLNLKATEKGSYSIINLRNVSNIKIINPRIVGDRETHRGNKGEWGMGIDIRGAQNISLYNVNIRNCWGDGLYIGHSKIPSKNISIHGGVIDNNRRNGVSVISVNGLNINKLLVSNSIGVDPGTGVDFEPNSHVNEIDNVFVKDLVTYNNMKNGVLIHLNKLVGKNEKNVMVQFENYKDFNSSRPVRVTGQYKNKDKSYKRIKGQIIFNGTKFMGNKTSSAINADSYFPKVKL